MELIQAKYISMFVLLTSNLIMTFIGIYIQQFLHRRNENVLSITQRIISCLTSGILLGTLLMLILPISLDLVAHQWASHHLGYLFVGLGFFLICIINELTNLYERYSLKKHVNYESEQLIDSSTNENRLTRLITLSFALGVHYFFEGVLIGGQTKDTTTLWILLSVICLHMSLVVFSVTLRLLIDNEKYSRVFYAMFSCSLMGPLGVFVSVLISSNTSTQLNIVNGILQCLSAGTFVYITFIHMIHDDLMKTKSYPFLNIVLIFMGFVIIVLVSFGHEHSS